MCLSLPVCVCVCVGARAGAAGDCAWTHAWQGGGTGQLSRPGESLLETSALALWIPLSTPPFLFFVATLTIAVACCCCCLLLFVVVCCCCCCCLLFVVCCLLFVVVVVVVSYLCLWSRDVGRHHLWECALWWMWESAPRQHCFFFTFLPLLLLSFTQHHGRVHAREDGMGVVWRRNLFLVVVSCPHLCLLLHSCLSPWVVMSGIQGEQ